MLEFRRKTLFVAASLPSSATVLRKYICGSFLELHSDPVPRLGCSQIMSAVPSMRVWEPRGGIFIARKFCAPSFHARCQHPKFVEEYY